MDLDVTNTLQEFLEAHGVATSREGDTLIAAKMKTSAWAYRKPSERISHMLQLDVRVESPLMPGRMLIESFAGWGSDEKAALNQAWEKFARASLHVLLEVFVGDRKGEDQIEWETWQYDSRSWRVCMGPLLTMRFGDTKPSGLACGPLLESLQNALLPGLTRECHWLRFYYMKQNGSYVGSECLLDNEEWPEGQNLVTQWTWPDGSYSVRLFLIVLPDSRFQSGS